MSGGGDRLWSENGEGCRMGEFTKFSPTGGGPPQCPLEKLCIYTLLKDCYLLIF